MWRKLVLFGLFCIMAPIVTMQGQEPRWDPAAVKDCDRPCLTAIMDRYTDAMMKHDPKNLPLAVDLRITENTAQVNIGEGILWRAKVEPTSFKYYVADPIAGQVSMGAVFNIEGRPALTSIRLRIERARILEIEQLVDRNIAPQAMTLLQKPRPGLLTDVPAAQRTSREGMIRAANSYFDALEGDNGKIAAFADDCVRHENGYQTSTNKEPGRAAPSPALPTADTPQGRAFLKLSTMTCSDQIDTKAFSFISKIRPRRVLIVDEQKGLVATFPLFIMDGTRRYKGIVGFPDVQQSGLGQLQNMVTMEVFGVRGGKIHEVEVFPFVTIPYGLGNGWTPGSGH